MGIELRCFICQKIIYKLTCVHSGKIWTRSACAVCYAVCYAKKTKKEKGEELPSIKVWLSCSECDCTHGNQRQNDCGCDCHEGPVELVESLEEAEMNNPEGYFNNPDKLPFLQISNTKRNFPEIVVLCGSTRFYDLFNEMNVKFTLQGKIVLSIGDHQRADHGTYYEEYKEMLDVLHKRKIDLADKVFVINKNGYIGETTRSEIDYAIKVNKPIEYMEV